MREVLYKNAARVIAEADALLITAGAGIGVDSGLPDFRGDEGFWNAYPPYRRLGKSFVEMANPAAFANDPAFAWGFYGHRLNLYRQVSPHRGFRMLKDWGERVKGGMFVMTSNVDGHFQAAGFDPDLIHEVHGSIHYLQCSTPCHGSGIWSASGHLIEVDENSMRADGSLPECSRCGSVARPNILMFGDWGYLDQRNREQQSRHERWLSERRDENLVIVELGAGSAVPTVRYFSEDSCRRFAGSTLIRVNPREAEIPIEGNHFSICAGALDALQHLNEEMMRLISGS
ncbi:MAG: Sir2 family NAD-dependent protein deacetylase [Verrucomicrobiota bacterium]